MAKVTQQSNGVSSFTQLRDELRLQAHLMKAELLERFNGLETRFEELQLEALAVREVAGTTRNDVSSAVSFAIESLQHSYEDIRRISDIDRKWRAHESGRR